MRQPVRRPGPGQGRHEPGPRRRHARRLRHARRAGLRGRRHGHLGRGPFGHGLLGCRGRGLLGGAGLGRVHRRRGHGTSTGGATWAAGIGKGSTGSGTGSGAGRKGVDVTLVVGTLKYLFPGKLTVTPESGPEQVFFAANDTKVLGATTLCGGPDGQVTITDGSYGTTTCTTGQLDKAAKLNAVQVRATIHQGIATEVEERHHP
ncbi:hypothetical protein [Streptomyces sp. NPDC018045]|uniref:hypothetical protein n=1 Tax=Streptomyces sp. NPDC018045 TaxID=3365037 RepID=UPI0037BA396B